MNEIAFGPVPSRAAGTRHGDKQHSPRICTYSCIYCRLGSTLEMQVERKRFYDVAEVAEDVRKRVREAEKAGEHIRLSYFCA